MTIQPRGGNWIGRGRGCRGRLKPHSTVCEHCHGSNIIFQNIQRHMDDECPKRYASLPYVDFILNVGHAYSCCSNLSRSMRHSTRQRTPTHARRCLPQPEEHVLNQRVAPAHQRSTRLDKRHRLSARGGRTRGSTSRGRTLHLFN